MKAFFIRSVLFYFCFSFGITKGADRLKDFRGTEQKVALLGFKTETVEPEIEKKFLEEFRKELNRYTRSYGQSSISGFTIGDSAKGKNYAPVSGEISEEQKKFLTKVGKDNAIDIIVLGQLTQQGLGLQVDLQLYDVRIETLSQTEKGSLTVAGERAPIENLVYKTMNYLDRDGFVHQSTQDFLLPPISSQVLDSSVGTQSSPSNNEFAVNPLDLAGGELAGRVTVGGDKQPFWETWWFWTVIGGGLMTAGGLSYYFLVVNQPPTGAKIQFAIP